GLDLPTIPPPPLASFTGFRSRIMASFIPLLTRRQADRTTLMFGICAFILQPPSPLFRSNVFSGEPQLRASEKLFLSARPRWGVGIRPPMELPDSPLPRRVAVL